MAKKKKPELFYVSKDKYQRAVAKAGAKPTPAKIKKAYEELGGAFSEGHGYMPV